MIRRWALAALAAVAFTGPAHAVVQTKTFNVGDLTNDSFWSVVTHSRGDFLDKFFFSLTAPSTFSSLLTTFRIGNAAGIVNSSASPFTLTIKGAGLPVAGETFAAISVGSGFSLTGLYSGDLNLMGAPGGMMYTAEVAGRAVGVGGLYTIGLGAVAAPVPEPGEWMMLLAGIMVIGFIVRRRRNLV